jgi:hypothetical protein
MRRMLVAAMMAALVSIAPGASAGGKRADGVARDSHGRIARSSHAKTAFRKSNPCPATARSSGACPGYVIDHVVPLKRGGPDVAANMQWQTRAAAREKDRHE